MGQADGHGIGTHRRRRTGHTPQQSSGHTRLQHPAEPGSDRRIVRRRRLSRSGLTLFLAAAVVVTASGAEAVTTGGSTAAANRISRRGTHLLAASSLPSRALYGWGGNDAGQVGVGAVGGGSATGVTAPAVVTAPAGEAFASVAAGGAFTVGLTTSGRVYTWGSGSLGQLGDGATAGSTVPVAVTVPSAPGGPPAVVTAVAAGDAHALALTSTGQVYAWGADLFGQLGHGGTTPADTPTLVTLPAGVAVTAIAAGGDHSLAVTTTGQVYAWGANGNGQVGDGSTVNSSTPSLVALPGGVAITGVAAGTAHSLAVANDGSVYAWGFNASGQLGTGDTADASTPQPVAVPSGVSIASVAAGGSHSLALTTTGTILAWGSDVFGQLASALVATLPVDSDVPVQPLGLPPATSFVQISAGQTTSYALTSGGVAVGVGWRLLRPGRRRLPRRQRRPPGRPDHAAPGNPGHRAVLGARRVGRLPGDPGPAVDHLPGATRRHLR